jgi:hypothetical protein
MALNFVIGGMAEWSKAADLRSVGRLSARVRTSLPSYFFLNFSSQFVNLE